MHTQVYTVVLAAVLAAVFDLSRIASLGAIFYLLMDITVHWGVLRHLHADVGANRAVLGAAIGLDATVLGAFLILKLGSDPLIVAVSLVSVLLVIAFEWFYLRRIRATGEQALASKPPARTARNRGRGGARRQGSLPRPASERYPG